MRRPFVSGWARRFVVDEPAEPKNVTPRTGDRAWVRKQVNERRAQLAGRVRGARVRAWRYLYAATATAIVALATPFFPSFVHWTAFFAAIVLGERAINAWSQMRGAQAALTVPEDVMLTSESETTA